MKLRWDQRAVQDLRGIRGYVAAQSTRTIANRVRRHLEKRIERLQAHPYIGARSGNPHVRILAPTQYPYRVYYSVQGDEIVILHIRRTARRAPDDLGQ